MADHSSSGPDRRGAEPTSDSTLEELVATRRDKLGQLREAGIEPYPADFGPTHSAVAVREQWDGLEAGEETGQQVTVAGRVVAKRDLGRLVFLEVLDDGTRLQLMVVVDDLDEGSRRVLELLDRGDWLGATGEVVASKRGELSVRPAELSLLSKSLRPLPGQHYGLEDVEQRYRRREVDLVVNETTREVFEIRSRVLAVLRSVLQERGFLEVETPMLHPIPGGAAARPFVTHHNALDTDLYLRIAPELYLKRLVAGGFDRVFELNRSFRNEGISPRHNPEFTMLEAYAAFADYRDVMALTEELVAGLAREVAGTTELTYQGRELSLSPPFRRSTLLELVAGAAGADELAYTTPVEDLRGLCDEHGVAWEQDWGQGRLIAELYEGLVEDQLWEPTFVIDHPVETSPLARRHREKDHVAERFELIAAGWELANAFSELTDPDDQRERFEAQAAARAAGDEEAMVLDETFLQALELGLPPTGGMGLGVDRVVMVLADVASIREVILFPTLRPKGTDTRGGGADGTA